MPTEAKRATVAELRDEIAGSNAAIVADYRGLTVGELATIRRRAARAGHRYRVVKNRLAKIAANEAGRPELSSCSTGRPAWRWVAPTRSRSPGRSSTPVRPYRTVAVRGALIGDHRIGATTSPPRQPAAARGAAGPAGRRHGRAAGRPGVGHLGAAAQPRLRTLSSLPPSGKLPAEACIPTLRHQPHPTKGERTNGHQGHPGPAARGDRRHDRPRAVRVHQEVRGALRRDCRRAGRRRRGARPPALPRPRPPPPRSRASSAPS
jgi:hypothetical protein